MIRSYCRPGGSDRAFWRRKNTMKTAFAMHLVLILELATAAQVSRTEAALTALQKVNPAVDWSVSSAKNADFDSDGNADTVMLGYQKDRVVVGVVWASPAKPQILSFPIGVPAQDGFTSRPNTIDIQPLDCAEWLKPSLQCQFIRLPCHLLYCWATIDS